MFDGRHCTYKDLELLRKETFKIKSNLNSPKEIEKYLKLVERFDFDIANKISREIKNQPSEMILSIINKNIELLEQNIIVDINEHKG